MVFHGIRIIGILLLVGLVCLSCGADVEVEDEAGDAPSAREVVFWQEFDFMTESETSLLPDFDDDEAIEAHMVASEASCPPVNSLEFPESFEMIMFGEQGCLIGIPQGWTSTQTEGHVEISQPPEGSTSYWAQATYLEGAYWSVDSSAGQVYNEMKQRFPDLQMIDSETKDDLFGLGIKIKVFIVKFTIESIETAGEIRVVHTGCSETLNKCPHTAVVTWAPIEKMESDLCILAQIDASLQCPSTGGAECAQWECNDRCEKTGAAFGYCSASQCICAG